MAARPSYFMFCFSNVSVSEVDRVSQGSLESTSYAPEAHVNHSPFLVPFLLVPVVLSVNTTYDVIMPHLGLRN